MSFNVPSPTKGRILAGDGSAWVAVGVGADRTVLTADASDAEGIVWQEPIASVVPILINNGAPCTNMPADVTEIIGTNQHHIKYDLANAKQVRTSIRIGGTAGFAGSVIRVQYSTDESAWSEISASPPNAAFDTGTNRVTVSSWVDLVAGAKADVFLRAVGEGGDGAVDPVLVNVYAQFR
jgi:hypothetical protein